jgi:hypothetical protein
MPATRTQVYFTTDQRDRLDQRARAEHKTLAEVVREAVDRHLSGELSDAERQRVLDETFGSCPDFGALVPSRDEWQRGYG